MGKKVAWLLVILIIIGAVGSNVAKHSFVKVDPGQRGIKRQWGQIQDSSYAPGLVWYIPFSEEMGNEVVLVDIVPHRYEYTFKVRTKDLQQIDLKCAVLCELNDSKVHRLYDKYQGYDAYEQKVIKDMVNSTMLALSSLTDIWSFVGREESMTMDAVKYIVNDQLLADNLVAVKTFRLLSYQASPEFEKLVEQTAQAKQGVKLEEYKAQMARQATERVKQEAIQAYERLAAVAKAEGLKIQIQAEALKDNPFVAQYEMAKALQKWNGNISLPQTLTIMKGANEGGGFPVFPFMKIGK